MTPSASLEIFLKFFRNFPNFNPRRVYPTTSSEMFDRTYNYCQFTSIIMVFHKTYERKSKTRVIQNYNDLRSKRSLIRTILDHKDLRE